MENEILEQPTEVLTADSVSDTESVAADNGDGHPTKTECGSKFASVEELEKAYQHLHAEFTRKSQRLRALEQEVAERGGQVGAGAAIIESTEKDATFVQKMQEGDKSKVIEEYLLALRAKAAPAVIASQSTDFAFTNLAEARSMNVTTKVAENFFKSKEKISFKL